MCVVRGPSQINGEYRHDEGRLVCSISRAPFAFPHRRDPSRGGSTSTVDDDALAEKLQAGLERVMRLDSFPQLQYDVSIDIVSADGCEREACVLAASTALLHASVEARDTLGAAHGFVTAEGSFVPLSSSGAEDAAAKGAGVLFLAATMHTRETVFSELRSLGCAGAPATAISAALDTVVQQRGPVLDALHRDLKK
jgi:ribonuclease PH